MFKSHANTTDWRPFPAPLAHEYEKVRVLIPDGRKQLSWSGNFAANVAPVDTPQVENQVVSIPKRIYNEEIDQQLLEKLSPIQQLLVHCLYTRHHNGFVRQRHLAHLLSAEQPWVIPYVFVLIGEYVVEILHDIEDGLSDLETPGSWQHENYGEFARNNTYLVELTKCRVMSYWNTYYRRRYSRPNNNGWNVYPGFNLVHTISELSSV